MFDFSHHGKHFRALRFFCSYLGIRFAALSQDGGDGRQRLNVIQHRGLLEQATLNAADVLGARLAHLALDGVHKGRGFAAHECAAATHNAQVQLVIGAHDVLAQNARCVRIVNGMLDMLARQGVFVANVEHAHLGANGQCANDHALDNGMGASLHGGAVHKRARVAFVAVAHDVFRRDVVACRAAPLPPRGEARATLTAQTALFHLGDNLVGRHGQGLLQTFIATRCKVLIQAEWIDDAHILQHHFMLQAVEGVVGLMLVAFPLLIAIQKLLYRIAFKRSDDIGSIRWLHLVIHGVARHQAHQRSLLAFARTTRAAHLKLYQGICILRRDFFL